MRAKHGGIHGIAGRRLFVAQEYAERDVQQFTFYVDPHHTVVESVVRAMWRLISRERAEILYWTMETPLEARATIHHRSIGKDLASLTIRLVDSCLEEGSKRRKDVLELKNELGPKYVIFMVGLPARGKRRVHGEADSSPASVTKQVENPSSTHPITTQHDANFFESSNTEAATLREKLAGETLEELIQWLHDGGKINVDPEVAIRDFKKRILNYEKVYQTIDEEEEKQNVRGYLPSQCNIVKRTIWLTRHGESVYNTVGRIGGDPQLSAIGKDYSTALLNFMEKNQESLQSEPLNNYEKLNDSMCSLFQSRPILRVLTSTLQRAIDTVEPFYSCPEHYEVHTVKFLNEIYSGSFEEMTYDEIMSKYPKEFEERKANKLLYRYPGTGGESIVDVIERLRPVIVELERMRKDVLVVTHQVVMRTLLAYFTGCPLQDVPKVDVPLHTLYKLEPKPYGADLKRCITIFIHIRCL
ncbi:hypothetical protein HDV02_004215 [Globomyces sp. JEL0801]|nr:hypothetical protein HDV02_004215 [Globomyces sp. JEL0801]